MLTTIQYFDFGDCLTIIFTVAYNPKQYWEQLADVAAFLIILIEIATDHRLFKEYRPNDTYMFDSDKTPFFLLDSYEKQYKGDHVVLQLIKRLPTSPFGDSKQREQFIKLLRTLPPQRFTRYISADQVPK